MSKITLEQAQIYLRQHLLCRCSRFVCGDIVCPRFIVAICTSSEEIDLATAGPPCTPFSRAGKMSGEKHKDFEAHEKLFKLIELYNNRGNHPKFGQVLAQVRDKWWPTDCCRKGTCICEYCYPQWVNKKRKFCQGWKKGGIHV